MWIRGDYVISDATLNRFFALHFLLPFILAALVFIHIVACTKVGSNNPDGIEIKKNKDENGIPKDGIPFHPLLLGQRHRRRRRVLIFQLRSSSSGPISAVCSSSRRTSIPANPLKTPPHIAPVWYFTPFYAMLRAVPPMFNSRSRASS